jgi:antitoxin ParD1/3/4
LKNKDNKLNVLRQMLTDGEESGKADYSYDSLMAELDAENYI